MTYGEASTSRTAVGSGLIYHGAPEVSHHDLNKHLSFFLTKKLYCVHIWTYFKYLFYLESGCTHWFVFYKQTWVDYSWPCLCFILIHICSTLWYSWYVHKQRMTIGILFILDSSSDSFLYCTCRSRCCSVHCEPCNCGSYILCASNTKHCEL